MNVDTQGPEPRSRLTREERAELAALVGETNLLDDPTDMLTYDCDATTMEKLPPAAVVFVYSTADVQNVVRWCNRHQIPFLARGAGTGLSGGALALRGGIIIELSRMNRILAIDYVSRIAVVEPGVINLHVTKAAEADGYYYAPDPSSQPACTVGGNVAENSGGPHTLKYGVTTNHILGLEVVLPNGELVRFGSEVRGAPGYDMVGLFTGSEGTFGIATRIVVRLVRNPEATKTMLISFPRVRDASETVAGITADGIIPAAMEMIDGAMCRAVEEHLKVGLPLDAGACLLVEVDGLRAGQDTLAERITAIANRHRAIEVRIARDEKERAGLWRARKGAFSAVGKLSPSFYTHDTVIPRSKMPDILEEIDRIAEREGLRIANVFHAGDGNLHPLVLFDDHDEEQIAAAYRVGEAILRLCVEAGGSLSGEHGIGFEKIQAMPWLFNEDTLDLMRELRAVFNPDELCNPGKAVPTPGRCVETKKMFGAVRYA